MVIEDSRLARHGLMKMLKNNTTVDVIADAENPEEALILIQQFKPELLFLDIHMPGGSGFDLLNQLDYSPKIIFTTAFSEYAIRSFEYNTIDYLLKPISDQRLELALDKLALSSDQSSEKQDKSIFEMSHKLFLKDSDQCHLVTIESIHYFESCKNYARIFFANSGNNNSSDKDNSSNNAFIKKSLSSIEQRLPQEYFFRVNRQYIVNLNSIQNIEEAISDGYCITMIDGKELEISRRNATSLKERLSF